jgi:NAD(P)-dependent dehydrogenase (short-subunit alcohol dehydrogenase family)
VPAVEGSGVTIRSNDRALVTGAASGLGLALTRQLAARGCRVLATDVAAEAPAVLHVLPAVTYRRLDVRNDADWADARDWVLQDWLGLDLLVNNAGVAAGGRIDVVPLSEWQWILDINLLGVVRGCATFAPILKAQRNGHVVNIASAAGLVHPPQMSAYNTVKAGVVALSETLSFELGAYGVTTSVVCPTFVRTNLAASRTGSDPEAAESARALIEGSKRTADEAAADVLAGIDARRYLILPDTAARMAYASKRFARPLYDRTMRQVAAAMARKART